MLMPRLALASSAVAALLAASSFRETGTAAASHTSSSAMATAAAAAAGFCPPPQHAARRTTVAVEQHSSSSPSSDARDEDGDLSRPDHSRHPFRVGYMSDVEGNWDYFLELVERSNVLHWEDYHRADDDGDDARGGGGGGGGGDDDGSSRDCDNGEGGGASSCFKFRRLALRRDVDAHFVYGGDAVDKGPGDVRLVRSLASLKSRHPDRVHLLVGNRDLNKLRLTSELSEYDDDDGTRKSGSSIDDVEVPFWNPSAVTYREHLLELQRQRQQRQGQMRQQQGAGDGGGGGGGGRGLEGLDTRAERLRWILRHTMGCPDTFEHRRAEVGLLRRAYGAYPPPPLPRRERDDDGGGVDDDDDLNDFTPHCCDDAPVDGGDDSASSSLEVTDEDVVDSFLYEMSPRGSLRQYLNLSSIAAIVGSE